MKLVTFALPAMMGARLGVVRDDGDIVELPQAAHPAFASMQALVAAGAPGLDAARRHFVAPEQVHPAAAVRLLAPLPRPAQLRDCLSFEKHLRQARAHRHLFGLAPGPVDPAAVELPPVWYAQPIYYKANRFSVVGPEVAIDCPAYEKSFFDYELEIAVCIGCGGRDIPRETALEHVFGATIFNDFSARSAQMREMPGSLGPAKGKDFDGGNAMGPWLVTRDEIGDLHDLTMVARVNGEERGRGHSGSLHHRFEDMIAHISQAETLHPGEMIGSGTVGDGCGLEHGRALADGDTVELEVSGLGRLRNTVRIRHADYRPPGAG